MVEQIRRLPIDPESVRYFEGHEAIYSLGRDEYAGMIFGFMENFDDNLQAALEKTKRMSSAIDTFVVGVGIDEDESDARRRAMFDYTSLGIWGNTLQDLALKNWLERKKGERYVKIE